MLQAAEMGLREDLAGIYYLPWNRGVVIHSFSLVRPAVVVKLRVFFQDPYQMVFSEDYHVIQAFPPD